MNKELLTKHDPNLRYLIRAYQSRFDTWMDTLKLSRDVVQLRVLPVYGITDWVAQFNSLGVREDGTIGYQIEAFYDVNKDIGYFMRRYVLSTKSTGVMTSDRMEDIIVHELGHAVHYIVQYKCGIDMHSELQAYLDYHATEENAPSKYSLKNKFEIFAEMFVEYCLVDISAWSMATLSYAGFIGGAIDAASDYCKGHPPSLVNK